MRADPTHAEPRPLSTAELAAIPIFPLPRVVLLPGSIAPLRLFEPRYRAMMRDCLEVGPRAMCLAMIEAGSEHGAAGNTPIHPIAGAGRIAAHHAHPDGTYELLLAGVHRVRLTELPANGDPYRRARAVVLVEVPPPSAEEWRRTLEPLLATAATLAALRAEAIRGEPPPIDLSGPPGMVIDRLADRWLRTATLRQRILEEPDVLARARLLSSDLVGGVGALTRIRRRDVVH